jgi:hypothetical protein
MKPEIKAIMDRHDAGEQLGHDDIAQLMEYCLELLREFEQLTEESIAYAKSLIS